METTKLGNGGTHYKIAHESFYELNGVLHREDGPAVIHHDEVGYRGYYLFGQLHNVDGPAEYHEYWDACAGMPERWYLQGERHRLFGPAVDTDGEDDEWYLFGVGYSEWDYNMLMAVKDSWNTKEELNNVIISEKEEE